MRGHEAPHHQTERESEREGGYNKVGQAYFLVETFYSEFSPLRASSVKARLAEGPQTGENSE